MATATLSNAQSLRVIGQDLNSLGVHEFNLGKKNGEYTLWVEERRSLRPAREWQPLLKKIGQVLSTAEDAAGQGSKPIHISNSEILWAHVAQGIRRKAPDGATRHDLSLLLRVIGEHLDEKAVDDFIIFWSANWVKVVYGHREENFTVLSLSEVESSMQLKRSSGSHNN